MKTSDHMTIDLGEFLTATGGTVEPVAGDIAESVAVVRFDIEQVAIGRYAVVRFDRLEGKCYLLEGFPTMAQCQLWLEDNYGEGCWDK